MTIESLDQSQIDLLLSLDDGLGEALAEIVDEFLSLTLQGRAELAREIRDGDGDALEHTAHTLKGASANVGATGLALVCAGVEVHAREEQLDAAAALMDQFDAELNRVSAALRSIATKG